MDLKHDSETSALRKPMEKATATVEAQRSSGVSHTSQGQLTATLLPEISDESGEVRLGGLLDNTKSHPELGSLPTALRAFLVDSNLTTAIQALNTFRSLGAALGPTCVLYIMVLAHGFINALGNKKHMLPVATLSCLNEWSSHAGLGAFLAGEVLKDALKYKNPILRAGWRSSFGWMADQLRSSHSKKLPGEKLASLLPQVYQRLEEGRGEARKKARDPLLPCALHLGYQPMAQAARNLEASSRIVVVTQLDKVRLELLVMIALQDNATILSGTGNNPQVAPESAVPFASQVNNAPGDEARAVECRFQKRHSRILVRRTSETTTQSSGKEGVDFVKEADRHEYNSRRMPCSSIVLMSRLAAREIDVVMNALAQVDELLDTESSALVSCTELLMKMMTMQYRLLYIQHMTDENVAKAAVIKLYHQLTTVLLKVFERRTLARCVSRNVLRGLLSQLMLIVLDKRHGALRFRHELKPPARSVVLHIIRNVNTTCVLGATIGCLHDSVCNVGGQISENYLKLVLTCLLKIASSLDHSTHELRLDVILQDLHLFLCTYGGSRPADPPLCMVQVLIYKLAMVTGPKLLTYAKLVPGQVESSLVDTVAMVLKMHAKESAEGNEESELRSVQEQFELILKSKDDDNFGEELLSPLRRIVDWSARFRR